MSIYGHQSRHWSGVGQRFIIDMMMVVVSFYAACVIRFEEWWPVKLVQYVPSIALGTMLLPVAIYILGLYTEESLHYSRLRRYALLLVAFSIMICLALAYGSVNFSARIGRGVMVWGSVLTMVLVWSHHEVIRLLARRAPLRLAVLILNDDDAQAARRLAAFDKPHAKFVGVVLGTGVNPAVAQGLPVLGDLDVLRGDSAMEVIDDLVVRPAYAVAPEVSSVIRGLRYQGLSVMTLMDAFEEFYQMAPVDLIDGGWLLQASSMPRMIYIRKLKRAFDIIVSIVLLMILGPVCLLGMALIKINSPGPVLFRQVRRGRHGRDFVVLKLRSMRLDAEANGPQWSRRGDDRVMWWGKILRKYRIDEIPQLINILRGEMSFVGPRPERPEFITELEQAIPHYRERLHLQPGLTGWAQVCFPYGETVDDARRKLQYDLYYLKHMSLALDLFILLDTVRIILRGATHAKAPAEPAVPQPLAGFEVTTPAQTDAV